MRNRKLENIIESSEKKIRLESLDHPQLSMARKNGYKAVLRFHDFMNLQRKDNIVLYWFDFDGVLLHEIEYDIPLHGESYLVREKIENGKFHKLEILKIKRIGYLTFKTQVITMSEKSYYMTSRTLNPNNLPFEFGELAMTKNPNDYKADKDESIITEKYSKHNISWSSEFLSLVGLRNLITEYDMFSNNKTTRELFDNKFREMLNMCIAYDDDGSEDFTYINFYK